MISQLMEHEAYAEVRHQTLLPRGGVYWVKIELTETPEGVLFKSPVDNTETLVEGITLKEFDTEWWFGDNGVEILDAVADMGGCRWILGNQTEYDYVEENGKHYLEVTEIMRGDVDEFLKEMKEELQG